MILTKFSSIKEGKLQDEKDYQVEPPSEVSDEESNTSLKKKKGNNSQESRSRSKSPNKKRKTSKSPQRKEDDEEYTPTKRTRSKSPNKQTKKGTSIYHNVLPINFLKKPKRRRKKKIVAVIRMIQFKQQKENQGHRHQKRKIHPT